MTNLILIISFFLCTTGAVANVKDKEKAKFDLISSIEVLVNIDECRKAILKEGLSVLPRVCSSLPELSKYFFHRAKDKNAIVNYLNKEESKITEESLKLVTSYNITKLGKMTLSQKCVKNKDPLDLDIYLNRIRGLPESEAPAKEDISSLEQELEPRNPAQQLDEEQMN